MQRVKYTAGDSSSELSTEVNATEHPKHILEGRLHHIDRTERGRAKKREINWEKKKVRERKRGREIIILYSSLERVSIYIACVISYTFANTNLFHVYINTIHNIAFTEHQIPETAVKNFLYSPLTYFQSLNMHSPLIYLPIYEEILWRTTLTLLSFICNSRV